MAAKSKLEKGLELFAKYQKEAGETPVDFSDIAKEATTEAEIKEARAASVASTEAVLKSLHYPHSLMMKKCEWCGFVFSTNYCYVSLCSQSCRKQYFFARYGIRWNDLSGPAFGEYEAPQIVDPKVSASLYEWAKAYVADYENLSSTVNEPCEDPKRATKQIIGIDDDGNTTIQEVQTSGHVVQREFPGVPLTPRSEVRNLPARDLPDISPQSPSSPSALLPGTPANRLSSLLEEVDFASVDFDF